MKCQPKLTVGSWLPHYQTLNMTILDRSNKDISMYLYLVATFGAIVGTLYGIMYNFIITDRLSVTNVDILLLTIGVVSMYMKELKVYFNKISDDRKLIYKLTFNKFWTILHNSSMNVLICVLDMFSYTAFLVPLFIILVNHVTMSRVSFNELVLLLMDTSNLHVISVGVAGVFVKNILQKYRESET